MTLIHEVGGRKWAKFLTITKLIFFLNSWSRVKGNLRYCMCHYTKSQNGIPYDQTVNVNYEDVKLSRNDFVSIFQMIRWSQHLHGLILDKREFQNPQIRICQQRKMPSISWRQTKQVKINKKNMFNILFNREFFSCLISTRSFSAKPDFSVCSFDCLYLLKILFVDVRRINLF